MRCHLFYQLTALHDELSSQLEKMAQRLKRNAIHLTSLAKYKASLEDATQKIESNFDTMKSQGLKLWDRSSQSRSNTWLVMGWLLGSSDFVFVDNVWIYPKVRIINTINEWLGIRPSTLPDVRWCAFSIIFGSRVGCGCSKRIPFIIRQQHSNGMEDRSWTVYVWVPATSKWVIEDLVCPRKHMTMTVVGVGVAPLVNRYSYGNYSRPHSNAFPDGGGIRGLSSLFIPKEILYKV